MIPVRSRTHCRSCKTRLQRPGSSRWQALRIRQCRWSSRTALCWPCFNYYNQLKEQQLMPSFPSDHAKQQLVEKYFQEEHEFDEQFVRLLFAVGQEDPQVQKLIAQHSLKILQSKQLSSIPLLQQLLARPAYHPIAHAFLNSLIALKNRIYNQPLLLYLLSHLPSLLPFLNKNTQEFIQSVITFLSLHMRSFDRNVKLTATRALKDLGGAIEGGEWEKVMRRVVPMMVEKQQLVKEVSYIKGLFLQMLEDQLHEVRILTIHCLATFRTYLKPEDLKQIIIYMLNDQHELVREEALQTAKTLKDMPLGKEDLSTLLMCLREKRTNLRRLVYENLSLVRLSDISLVSLLLQKVLTALQNYRSDKKHIYRALYEIGRKYYIQMGKIFPSLGLSQAQEPNCKNIGYKAKMVLCHSWWRRKVYANDSIRLPPYFVKHMLYISDVEAYLFDSPTTLQEEATSSVDRGQLQSNFHHLVRFIECEEDISQEFHKTVLEVAREAILGHTQKEELLHRLASMSITFNLGREQEEIKAQMQEIVKKGSGHTEGIIEAVMRCIQNRQAFQLKNSLVAFNKCTVSRLQPNLIVSSKCTPFIERVYLKCWKHSLLSKQRKVEYKRLSELERLSENEVSFFWQANLSKYNQVQILLCCFGSEKVLDNYDLQQR